jgi:putative DNA primase/helicase
VAYGLWRLDEALGFLGDLWLVEGETDALTAWLHDLAAIGIPGADMTKVLTADVFDGPVRVWILEEPDQGGATFVAGCATRLKDLGFAGEARIVRLPVKDLNDLHCQTGDGFAAALARAQAESRPLDAVTVTPQGVTGADEAWPTPEPVPTALSPVPAFDPALLPTSFAPWIADIAERAQCPIDFVAIAAVVAAGAVLGRQCTIRPKQHDDWTVVPNLWGVAIGRPGIMKSPALDEACRPLQRLVTEAHAVYLDRCEAFAFDETKAKAKRDLLQGDLKAALKAGATGEAFREAFAQLEPAPPTEHRYLVNDATVEKLGELLNENPNGLLLFRDELVGWLRTMDREGHENDRAFFCEGWNGTGAYTYDRIGRGTVRIDAACVSVLGGLQPGPLHAYLREAFGRGQNDDGLIQRFQLMVYPDIVTDWRHVDRWPDTTAKNEAFAIYRRLADLDLDAVGAHRETPDALPVLHFTDEAQAIFNAWRAELEARLRNPAEHPVVIAHFAKYRSLVPALALLFHLIDCVAHGRGGPVSESASRRAIGWCTYLDGHARRVYESVTAGEKVAAARLATEIQAGTLPGPFTARAVLRKGWSGLTDPADVEAALAVLEELHWLRAVAVRPTAKGGRRTTMYLVNPGVTGGSRL